MPEIVALVFGERFNVVFDRFNHIIRCFVCRRVFTLLIMVRCASQGTRQPAIRHPMNTKKCRFTHWDRAHGITPNHIFSRVLPSQGFSLWGVSSVYLCDFDTAYVKIGQLPEIIKKFFAMVISHFLKTILLASTRGIIHHFLRDLKWYTHLQLARLINRISNVLWTYCSLLGWRVFFASVSQAFSLTLFPGVYILLSLSVRCFAWWWAGRSSGCRERSRRSSCGHFASAHWDEWRHQNGQFWLVVQRLAQFGMYRVVQNPWGQHHDAHCACAYSSISKWPRAKVKWSIRITNMGSTQNLWLCRLDHSGSQPFNYCDGLKWKCHFWGLGHSGSAPFNYNNIL